MKKKALSVLTLALLVAVVISLATPTKVDITQEGFLSLSSNVALAVGEEPLAVGIYETDWGYEYVLTGRDSVEVRNKSTTDFKPTVKLNRWDGECFITLQPAGEVEEEVEYEVEGNKVKCKYKVKQGEFEFEWESEFYPLEPTTVIAEDKDGNDVEFTQNELGGFEFEIILKEKPPKNEIVLDFEMQGLKAYPQPPLTAEEIAEGCIRPENVEGGIAFYHDTRTNMHASKEDAEKYKCGKAGTFYRPKVKDAVGKGIWADLLLDELNGKLIITVDQTWLDNAVYPVSIDPNFGYETIGGTPMTVPYADMYGSLFTSPAGAATADSITAYVRPPISSTDLKGIIVLHSNLNILTNGVGGAVEAEREVAAWVTSTFGTSPSLSGSTGYVLMIIPAGALAFYYDAGDTDQGHYDISNNYYNPTNPTDASHNDNKYSIYCTYTAGAAPGISNIPSSKAFGILEVNTYSSTAINYFTITNTGSGAVDITVHATDLTGGDDTWTLSDTATPGENIYGLKAGLDDDDDLFDVVVKKSEAYNELVNNLAEDATQDWGLRLYMPTSVTNYDGQQMSATLTLVCSTH